MEVVTNGKQRSKTNGVQKPNKKQKSKYTNSKYENHYCDRTCMALNRTKTKVFVANCKSCKKLMKEEDRIILATSNPSKLCKVCRYGREEVSIKNKIARQDAFIEKFKQTMAWSA